MKNDENAKTRGRFLKYISLESFSHPFCKYFVAMYNDKSSFSRVQRLQPTEKSACNLIAILHIVQGNSIGRCERKDKQNGFGA